MSEADSAWTGAEWPGGPANDIANLSSSPLELPADHRVLLASAPIDRRQLAPDSTVWLQLDVS